jgi:hypothetical protein
MNKTQATKELKMWNSVRVVNGLTIANVGWFNDPWIIVETGKTFDEVSDRSYKPVKSFHTRAELLNELFKK